MAFAEQWVGTLIGIQGSKKAVNRIFWAADVVNANAQPQHLTAVLYDWWSNFLQNRLHQDYTLLQIDGQVGVTGSGIVRSHTLSVNEQGNVSVGDSMAPHDTVLVKKLPDNTTIDPVGEQPFTFGKISFSGIPESDQANGLVTAAALVNWNGTMEEIETLTLDSGGTPYQIKLGMFREANSLVAPNPRTYCYVLETDTHGEIGTQNRRKR